jgi:radical SAM protein with 4Fe4S-binding SPASM domain
MFVSEDMKMYPCSFMVEAGYEGIPIVGDNMQTHWQAGNDFVKIRNKLGSGSCDSCKSPGLCLGGCPLFPEINLCPKSSSCANSTASAQIIPLDAVSIAGKRH